MGFEGIFKGLPHSIICGIGCECGGNMITSPFPGLGSLFEVSQGRRNLFGICIIGSSVDCEVVVEDVPEHYRFISVPIKGFWGRPQNTRLIGGHW